MGIHGNLEDRPYKCKACPKSFVHKPKLKQHEKIHENLKSYVCE